MQSFSGEKIQRPRCCQAGNDFVSLEPVAVDLSVVGRIAHRGEAASLGRARLYLGLVLK